MKIKYLIDVVLNQGSVHVPLSKNATWTDSFSNSWKLCNKILPVYSCILVDRFLKIFTNFFLIWLICESLNMSIKLMFFILFFWQYYLNLSSCYTQKDILDILDSSWKKNYSIRLNHRLTYRRTSLYSIDASQTKLAYNEFAYKESNSKPN